MCTLVNINTQSELPTNRGRIDLTIIVNKYIYLFELKCDQSPQKALEQIERKKYYEKYLGMNKKIILVGVSFNKDEDGLLIDCITKKP
jgi:hypothetical protein